jgi:hypothetical protein
MGLGIQAIEVAGDGQHGAARVTQQVVRDRADLDAPATARPLTTDDDQAGADLGRDVLELLPRLAAAQEAGDLDAARPKPGDDARQRRFALDQAPVVEVVNPQLADVDQGDPRGDGCGEVDGHFEGLLRALAEVGAGHEVFKPLHGTHDAVSACPLPSDLRWTRAPGVQSALDPRTGPY